MSMLKDFRFQVHVGGEAERTVTLTASGKPTLTVATPPEFRGGVPDVWSPEDLLVASTATCYALTLVAVAERRAVPLRDLEITGAGHVAKRADGRFGFVVIELGVRLTTDEGFEDEARKASGAAESACIISNALAVPVEVELRLRTIPAGVPSLIPAR
jgi:organic hydroperoxide reductase OsmC/OhrA